MSDVVVVVGNPRASSRTHTVAAAAAAAVAPGRPAEVVDLTELAHVLLLPGPAPELAEALEKVKAADILVVASPTYKGTYTGLLKCFFDLLRAGDFRDKIALPLMVMGSPRHALAVEVHLRPLLVELGATVPTPGLAVVEADLERLDEVLSDWVEALGKQVRR